MDNLETNYKVKKSIQYKSQIALLIMTASIFGLFMITSPEVFLKGRIYQSFLSTVPIMGLMALGLTFVLAMGEIDLSFPSVMALSGFIFSITFKTTNSVILALIFSILSGVIVGFINGTLVTSIGIPSIVATLGMQFLIRGFSNIISNGLAKTVAIDKTISYKIFAEKLGAIPVQSIWFAGIAIFLYFLLFRHRFGEHVLFIGDNREAARMMGVNVNSVKIMVFVLMGVMASFAGILSCYRMRTWWPTMGEGYIMMVMAAVFIGGTSMLGGVASIEGTFIGAFIIGSLEAGIVAAGLSGFWTQFVCGVLIIASVTIHTLAKRRK
ncbi:ABC transporter permease [bacterium]|jgi:simple sugar transport system permease protein|nr:ABC transporter permease [Patescibacteria group bacterium]MBU4362772.1 ABC transporter permease [bacterium]